MSMLLPIQVGMMQLTGCNRVPRRSDDPATCKDVMRSGREMLAVTTDVDFGFDIEKWREYLLANYLDAYKWHFPDIDEFIVEQMADDRTMALLAELDRESEDLA